MKRSNLIFGLILILGLSTFILPTVFSQYIDINEIPGMAMVLIVIVYILLFMLGMYFRFEESNVSSKEIALIAIYSAFAAVARISRICIWPINWFRYRRARGSYFRHIYWSWDMGCIPNIRLGTFWINWRIIRSKKE